MAHRRLSPRDYVVYLLGRREYSEKELRDKLKLRECTDEELEEAIAFVKELGLQSDARYATLKARSEGRRKGDRSIRRSLAAQNIATEDIEQELQALTPECERVLAAVKRFEGTPLDFKTKGKVWRFLAYRGFSGDAIRAALEHLKNTAEAA